MKTREAVADVITYCKKNDISYKTRLSELGIPAWKFYDSKSRYALEQESSEAKGVFVQLYAGGSYAPVPSFAATSGRKVKVRYIFRSIPTLFSKPENGVLN